MKLSGVESDKYPWTVVDYNFKLTLFIVSYQAQNGAGREKRGDSLSSNWWSDQLSDDKIHIVHKHL